MEERGQQVSEDWDWRANDPIGTSLVWSGAGILPFALLDAAQARDESEQEGYSSSSGKMAEGEVKGSSCEAHAASKQPYFLFHTKAKGKKAGFLIDFGGGRESKDESRPLLVAARELNEETGGLFFASAEEREEAIQQHIFDSNKTMQRSTLVAKATHRLLCQLTKEYTLTTFSRFFSSPTNPSDETNDNNKRRPVWHCSGGYHMLVLELDYIPSKELNQVFAGSDRGCTFHWVPAEYVLAHRDKLYPRVRFRVLFSTIIPQICEYAERQSSMKKEEVERGGIHTSSTSTDRKSVV